jgi:aromatic ring-opening dioxygenase LigB subunit
VDYSVRELYIDEEVRMTSQETKLAALMTRLQSSQQMQEEMKKLIQEEAQAVLITPANYDEVDAAEFALAVHSMIKEPEKHVVIIAEEDDGVVYTDEQGPRVRQVSSILKEAGVTVYDSVDAFQEVIEGQTHVTGDDTTTVE